MSMGFKLYQDRKCHSEFLEGAKFASEFVRWLNSEYDPETVK